jgi:hypothetical protein
MPLQLTRKKARIVRKALSDWEKEGTLSAEDATELSSSIQVIPLDWKKIAGYAFLLAVISLVISISAVISDKYLMELLARLFSAPAAMKSVFFALVAALFLFFGFKRIKNKPHRKYSNEAIVFLGVLSIAASVGFLGVAIGKGSDRISLLFLMASFIYALIGWAASSRQVWVFALMSLGAWFGAQTGYISGWGAYYFGMNFPLRFVIFGLALTLAGFIMEKTGGEEKGGLYGRLAYLAVPTRVMGYLYLFMALWIMSIFGNYGDMHSWRRAGHAELFHWSLLFGAVALACIYHGVKYDDSISRGFGITFILINLYTRFFEFFWGSLHKALFFAVLAGSFWLLGRHAEKLWNSGGKGE